MDEPPKQPPKQPPKIKWEYAKPKHPPKQPPKITWEYATPYNPPPKTQYIHLIPIEKVKAPSFIPEIAGTPEEILQKLVKMLDENEKHRTVVLDKAYKYAKEKSKLYKNEEIDKDLEPLELIKKYDEDSYGVIIMIDAKRLDIIREMEFWNKVLKGQADTKYLTGIGRKLKRINNPWIEFVKKNRGRFSSLKELSVLYHSKRK
jgi:hypothetical protein